MALFHDFHVCVREVGKKRLSLLYGVHMIISVRVINAKHVLALSLGLCDHWKPICYRRPSIGERACACLCEKKWSISCSVSSFLRTVLGTLLVEEYSQLWNAILLFFRQCQTLGSYESCVWSLGHWHKCESVCSRQNVSLEGERKSPLKWEIKFTEYARTAFNLMFQISFNGLFFFSLSYLVQEQTFHFSEIFKQAGGKEKKSKEKWGIKKGEDRKRDGEAWRRDWDSLFSSPAAATANVRCGVWRFHFAPRSLLLSRGSRVWSCKLCPRGADKSWDWDRGKRKGAGRLKTLANSSAVSDASTGHTWGHIV